MAELPNRTLGRGLAMLELLSQRPDGLGRQAVLQKPRQALCLEEHKQGAHRAQDEKQHDGGAENLPLLVLLEGTAFVDTLYTKAYLHHLVTCGEMLAAQIASLHNIAFYLRLVGMAREHIAAGDFKPWKDAMVAKLTRRL